MRKEVLEILENCNSNKKCHIIQRFRISQDTVENKKPVKLHLIILLGGCLGEPGENFVDCMHFDVCVGI